MSDKNGTDPMVYSLLVIMVVILLVIMFNTAPPQTPEEKQQGAQNWNATVAFFSQPVGLGFVNSIPLGIAILLVGSFIFDVYYIRGWWRNR